MDNSYFHVLFVKGIEVYKNDVVVKYGRHEKRRKGKKFALKEVRTVDMDFDIDREDYAEKKGGGEGSRGEIRELSKKSRRKLAFIANNTSISFESLITLTYPKEYPCDGSTVKYHLKLMLNNIRKKYGCEYIWFLEFQKRGAPHFHIITDIKGIDKDWLSGVWYGIVGSGDDKHLRAGTRVESVRSKGGLSRYVVKYAMKTEQKAVPRDYWSVGRFWGASRGAKPVPMAHSDCDRDMLIDLLRNWGYVGKLSEVPMSVLFNATAAIEVDVLNLIC